MLRKLSRRLTGQRRQDVEDEQEFRSAEAVAHDKRRAAALAKDPRTEAKDTATLPRRSWDAGDEDVFYTNRALEALTLENIIAPTLVRMAPTMASREAITPPPSRIKPLPPLSGLKSLPLPPRPDVLVLSEGVPGITMTPCVERPNPFEQLETINELQVTPMPARPPLRRQAVSYRTHRDLPLRVQAVRRAHQEEFSRQLAHRPNLSRAPSRRGSDPAPTQLTERAARPGIETHPTASTYRPPQPLTPPQALKRSNSEAELHQLTQRPHARTRTKSRSRSPIPDVPPKRAGDDAIDYYLESAQPLWQMPDSPGRMT
jgi:hypothetical protein